ncbi:hypothetical protein P280DRAFT_478656 [Massarina eburnea CBS 473.64]|uniref:Uncharacterized protein n=1 Tax=Massarina eburnea CBS 473.64 TaxID=1395130 RepID=A0A6A6S4D2_9PLEO|nr:hypothetical protein P280DRAFT_478656 [Massarina eburnea CBS 473.64]
MDSSVFSGWKRKGDDEARAISCMEISDGGSAALPEREGMGGPEAFIAHTGRHGKTGLTKASLTLEPDRRSHVAVYRRPVSCWTRGRKRGVSGALPLRAKLAVGRSSCSGWIRGYGGGSWSHRAGRLLVSGSEMDCRRANSSGDEMGCWWAIRW